ncbi:MAG: PEP-CTERM sorting domain-containing protein [Gammaproteobacteria bacterium]|nr:PEP-CTERM sorting domain-containing protein [Gammaproteobacteria bacterium]
MSFRRITLVFILSGFAASATAIPVTVNMTADNVISSGGLCTDAACTAGATWGALSAGSNWRVSDTVVFDLDYGTHYFAWRVTNLGNPAATNPAGLLAEILWGGSVNYSSSSWEVFDLVSGNFVEAATEYGSNAANTIWNRANGTIAGISDAANWIYGSDNFSSSTPATLWIRTNIRVDSVPEPGTVGLLGAGLLGLALMRRRRT